MAAVSTATVRFRCRSGHLMLPVLLNESERRAFMLDTGYSMTMIEPSLARRLGLRPAGRVRIVGIAGQVTSIVYQGVTLALGGLRYRPRRMATLSPACSAAREGILGSDFFRRFVVEIDHPDRTVRLFEPATFRHRGRGEQLPLRFKGTTPIVEATILRRDGTEVTGQFEVDTGCTGAICLGRDFVREHRLDDELRQARPGARQGVGGEAPIRAGRLAGLRLGGLLVPRPEVNCFIDGSPADDGLAGHLGVEILRPYHVIFDYSRRRLTIERRADRRARGR